jgi:Zn-dependent oligopeptidase
MAKTLTHVQYLTLRNIARVLRLSGAGLTSDQEEKVKKIEAAVAEYEQEHRG